LNGFAQCGKRQLLVEHNRLGRVEPNLRYAPRLESRQLEGDRVRPRREPGRQVSAGAVGKHGGRRGSAIGHRHGDTRQGAAGAVGDDTHQPPAAGRLLLSRHDWRQRLPCEEDRCE
jgi:hypothetical protein